MAVGALVKLTPKPGVAKELFDKTVDVIADVRTEPGNLMSVIMRDADQPDAIYLFEIYRSQAAIADHNVATHTVEKGPQLRALLDGPPQSRWFETIGWPETE